jgi:hypothetical protein
LIAQQNKRFDTHQQQLKLVTDMFCLQKVNEQSIGLHQSIRKIAQSQFQSTIAQEHANKSDLQRQIKIAQPGTARSPEA